MIKMKNSTIIYGSIFAIFVVARTAAVIGAGALPLERLVKLEASGRLEVQAVQVLLDISWWFRIHCFI